MKRILVLFVSCLLLSVTGFAQGDKSVVRMNLDIPNMNAAMAEKAVAAVSAVPGVIEVKPNVKDGKLRVSMAQENNAATRKAVRKALKDAGIQVARGDKKQGDEKKKQSNEKQKKGDDKSAKKAKAAK